jgi:hypothetical protein
LHGRGVFARKQLSTECSYEFLFQGIKRLQGEC